jgi:hypothetical protein
VSIFPKLFLALVGRNFTQLAFSSAGHFSVSLKEYVKQDGLLQEGGPPKKILEGHPFPRVFPGQAGKFV